MLETIRNIRDRLIAFAALQNIERLVAEMDVANQIDAELTRLDREENNLRDRRLQAIEEEKTLEAEVTAKTEELRQARAIIRSIDLSLREITAARDMQKPYEAVTRLKFAS